MDSGSPSRLPLIKPYGIALFSQKTPPLTQKIDFEISRMQVRVNGRMTGSEGIRLRVEKSPMIQFTLISRYLLRLTFEL
jgi:hypothetical protein